MLARSVRGSVSDTTRMGETACAQSISCLVNLHMFNCLPAAEAMNWLRDPHSVTVCALLAGLRKVVRGIDVSDGARGAMRAARGGVHSGAS
jgi:hypothetical protein